MKKMIRNCVMLFAVALLAAMAWGTEQADAASQVRINSRNFPDKTIRKVARSYDKNKNGYLSPKEISKIKKVSLKKTKYGDMIANYKGLERFTNLRILHCSEAETQSKKEIVLDLSKNKKLRELCLGYHDYESNVTKLKLTNCKKLTSLEITCATRLKTLDVKGCASLKGISVSNSRRLTALDVSSCRELEELRVFDSRKLSKLKLGTIGELSTLELGGCPRLKKLDLRKQFELASLEVRDCPGLKTLDLRKQTKLMELIVLGAPIRELDLKKQGELQRIEISGTKLKRLDLTGTKLTKEALINYEGHCRVDDKNIEVVFADGEKMISPVDSYDWKRSDR